MAIEIARRRFTASDYHRMAEVGILTEDGRVELIAGEIVEMSPIGPKHAACTKRLIQLLTPTLSNDFIVDVQDPISLGDDSEPQPDIAILYGREDYYESRLPTAHDVASLFEFEIVDTMLSYDRNVKLPLYARAVSANVGWSTFLGEVDILR